MSDNNERNDMPVFPEDNAQTERTGDGKDAFVPAEMPVFAKPSAPVPPEMFFSFSGPPAEASASAAAEAAPEAPAESATGEQEAGIRQEEQEEPAEQAASDEAQAQDAVTPPPVYAQENVPQYGYQNQPPAYAPQGQGAYQQYGAPQYPYTPQGQPVQQYGVPYNAGYPQQQVMNVPPQPQKKSRKGLTVFFSLLAVAIVAVAAISVVSWFNRQNNDATPEGGSSANSPVVETKKTPQSPTDLPDDKTVVLTSTQIAAKVKPSVVGIVVYADNSGGVVSEGSGILWKEDGAGNTYIITCAHVISNTNGANLSFTVQTEDGTQYDAERVGLDSKTDIGLLRINKTGLPLAELGDSGSLQVGDPIYAIGNPGGTEFFGSFTQGVVSAIDRPIQGRYTMICIQHDAAINPGNSGGALVNIRGELIGINTMIYTQSGGNMGIGFAIPINMARRIMEDLIFDGKVSRGWLGVSIQELDQSTRDAFGLSAETRGVLIGDVFKDQPADRAGIRRGDVVTSIDGKPTETTNQLRNHVATIYPGKTVPVEILRNGKKTTVQVKLTSRDASEQVMASADVQSDALPQSDPAQILGMKAGAITPELRESLNLQKSLQGVAIAEIARGSQAAQEGLRVNDLILEVNRKPVASVKDFSQAVKNVKPGDTIVFLIQREGNTFYRAFKVRR